MKRDSTCNVSIATEHPLMSEDANLKATYRPGREGGTFGLPLGAKLIVGEGMCTKKDYVTCQVASPAQRWRHSPTFPGEHVTSEIFTLSGNILRQGREAILILPYYPPPGSYVQLTARAVWEGQGSWQEVPFVQKDAEDIPGTDTPQPCLELAVQKMGTFVITFRPRTDPLPHLTPQGGLFHSRLNRNISLRFPKKAIVDTNVQYELEIIEVPEERVEFCKEHFPTACLPLLRVSEFIHLHPSHPNPNFRRSATIKLPLPAGVTWEEGSDSEIVVLHKGGDPGGSGWQWVDCKYRYTRNSVTFDIKNPNMLCVVQAAPDRQRKMQEAVALLEKHVHTVRGDVTLFLSLQPKSWQLVLDCFPSHLSPTKLRTRCHEQGFTALHKTTSPILSEEQQRHQQQQQRQQQQQQQQANPGFSPSSFSFSSSSSFSRRGGGSQGQAARRPGVKTPEGIPLFDGLRWTVEVAGDLRGVPRSEMVASAGLQWFRHLPDSYRLLGLEPATLETTTAADEADDDAADATPADADDNNNDDDDNDNNDEKKKEEEEEKKKKKKKKNRDLQGIVTLTPVGVDDDPDLHDQLRMQFLVVIPEQAVKDYRSSQQQQEQQPAETAVAVEEEKEEEEKPVQPRLPPVAKAAGPRKPVFTFTQTPMERLTQQPRRFVAADKEAKVLNGRSLTVLAKLVDNGVGLAIQLGLKESTVSGIGFDMMSHNKRSLSDLTYKILLLWKRSCRQKQDGAVQDLVTALQQMGKTTIAQIVADRHRHNQELTMDCFYQALVSGVDLSA